MMQDEPKRGGRQIVWILGSGRSGSTLLSSMLAAQPGCVAIGETLQMAQIFAVDCASLPKLWVDVHDRMGRSAWNKTGAAVARLARTTTTWPPARSHRSDVLLVADLYHAILDAADANVIIESSKAYRFASLIEATGQFDCAHVHLIRNPRGVAMSYQKSRDAAVKSGQARGYYRESTPFRVAGGWVLKNLLVSKFLGTSGLPARTVDYDELVSAPGMAIGKVLALLKPSEESRPSTDVLEVGHLVTPESLLTGNRGVRGARTLELRMDEQYKQDLRFRPIIDLITWLPWKLLTRHTGPH